MSKTAMRTDSDTEDADVYSASYGLDNIPDTEIFHYNEIESPDL